MAKHGLSLVGFMEESAAMAYLQNNCVLVDPSPDGIRRTWDGARKRLGRQIRNAGKPTMRDIPQDCAEYIEAVKRSPRFAETVEDMDYEFKLVEIDPLLAYQHHIWPDRSVSLCARINGIPRPAEMLPICLPLTVEPVDYQTMPLANGVVVKFRSNNLRVANGGVFTAAEDQQMFAGIRFLAASPLMHVIEFEGRSYLRNGFHRAYGLRVAQATHMPCIVLHTDEFSKIGAQGGGATFERDLLESENPPTCGHFTLGRATEVRLRDVTGILQVTWSVYPIPDEE